MSIAFTGYTIEPTHYLVDYLRLVEFPKTGWIRMVVRPKNTNTYTDDISVTNWTNAALKCTSGKLCVRKVPTMDSLIVFFESASDAVTVKLMGYDDLSQFCPNL